MQLLLYLTCRQTVRIITQRQLIQLWCSRYYSTTEKFILFDPTYGLPLPGPDQSIATLTDVQQQAQRYFCVPGTLPEKPYWVTEDLVAQVIPFVEASPQSLIETDEDRVQTALGRSESHATGQQLHHNWRIPVDALESDVPPTDLALALRGKTHSCGSCQCKIVRELRKELGQYTASLSLDRSKSVMGRSDLQQLAGRYTTQIEGSTPPSHTMHQSVKKGLSRCYWFPAPCSKNCRKKMFLPRIRSR